MMAFMPRISVVIPLYNKAAYVSRAINSVLSQTFKEYEIIVVDDGSTDDGKDVVNKYRDSRIRLIQQSNMGVSAARNRGIGEAQSEMIAFLDADDEWSPEHLSTLVRLRLKFPEAGAYGTAYQIIMDNHMRRTTNFYSGIPIEPWEGILSSYFKAATLGDQPITASTAAVPKSVLIEMGGFSTEAWWGEDTDLWGRIALKYPIVFSWNGIGFYHAESSNSACKKLQAVEENIFVIHAKNALTNGEVSLQLVDELQEYIALKQIQTASHNLLASRPDLARKNIKKCKTHYHEWLKLKIIFWAHMPSLLFIKLREVKKRYMD